MLTIRPAQESDTPIILDLIRRLAVYERMGHAVIATEAGLRQSLFGPRPYAEVLLAEWNADVVGFALYFYTYSTFNGWPGIYLEDLFVADEHRGRGIGKALLQRLAQLAVERGCGRVEWAVLNWNEPAIGFYRRLGAVPMDQWTIYRLSGDALAQLATK
jgi:GNAT superfamily N-acetyltransferase